MKYCLQQKKKQENIFVKMIEEYVDVKAELVRFLQALMLSLKEKNNGVLSEMTILYLCLSQYLLVIKNH